MSDLTTERANSLPKYARVAASICAQIADGTLNPGATAPSGAALARITGYSALTCRKALGALIKTVSWFLAPAATPDPGSPTPLLPWISRLAPMPRAHCPPRLPLFATPQD